jgi:hypothetical protein
LPKLCRLFENDAAFLASVGFLKMTRLFWNAGKDAKNPALWNHLEPPLQQMNQYKVN